MAAGRAARDFAEAGVFAALDAAAADKTGAAAGGGCKSAAGAAAGASAGAAPSSGTGESDNAGARELGAEMADTEPTAAFGIAGTPRAPATNCWPAAGGMEEANRAAASAQDVVFLNQEAMR